MFLYACLLSPVLQVGKFDSFGGGGACRGHSFQIRALDTGCGGAADEAIEPVVIGAGGTDFPFIHDPIAGHGLDAELRGQVVG